MLKEKAQSLARENPIIGNCEECEYEDNLIRHHDDYNNPMDIRILCRKCHAIWHKIIRQLMEKQGVAETI